MFQFSISYVFFLNPPVASQLPPLQREARKKELYCFSLTKGGKLHKPLIINTKTEKKKNLLSINKKNKNKTKIKAFCEWILYPITRLPQAFGLRNDKPRIIRLPRVAKATLAMTVCGCCLLFPSSLRAKRSNPQTTKRQYKNRKEKKSLLFIKSKN